MTTFSRNRRQFLTSAGRQAAGLACASVIGRAQAQHPPLNIVFILADDMGWSDLGCYGSSFYWRASVGAVMPVVNPKYDPATAHEGLTGENPAPVKQ